MAVSGAGAAKAAFDDGRDAVGEAVPVGSPDEGGVRPSIALSLSCVHRVRRIILRA